MRYLCFIDYWVKMSLWVFSSIQIGVFFFFFRWKHPDWFVHSLFCFLYVYWHQSSMSMDRMLVALNLNRPYCHDKKRNGFELRFWFFPPISWRWSSLTYSFSGFNIFFFGKEIQYIWTLTNDPKISSIE